MKTGPRFKIAKRLGVSVFEKAQSQKFAISAERSAKRKGGGRRGASEYGKQMLEKQKVRVTYGLPERQFRNYVRKALAIHSATLMPHEHLHALLELRLDNVVYRLGLATTRRGARQMVAHGHIVVNGKRVRVPSYQVRTTDRIAVRGASKTHGVLANFALRAAERSLPRWLSWDVGAMEGAVTQVPSTESAEPAGDLHAVLSFYTR
ncbi:30S ribosomal protein S4 [Candidatus Kaiserbacteria bacterium RIFCSPHIGHO2_02_FULL_56_30]|uniref:Small ribosomal subunit protein uS4 n=1 Tax=Candidatus Kaiserbacteria bacterium RIFCSPHIGHO2_02_FULL_56_30 TaxID=1798499 RepID=A0A1F6E3V6_9BACT|nr:MAG: 30S ribosomal protein S4 [Candidatus Kaiserbacteria bacterium RIFCSPHIGHO2_02_FULL_56_30]